MVSVNKICVLPGVAEKSEAWNNMGLDLAH
jgi:hypothetical protein